MKDVFQVQCPTWVVSQAVRSSHVNITFFCRPALVSISKIFETNLQKLFVSILGHFRIIGTPLPLTLHMKILATRVVYDSEIVTNAKQKTSKFPGLVS